MVELFPEGFEEVERSDGVELVAYTDPGGEERLWQAFGRARAEDVTADWEDRWKAFHSPVRIGSLWIGPPWFEPPADVIVVVIDPGRAFGTGAHPTTQLCVELLLELTPASVVDLGCGSGVLAIAAAKLGFGPIVALDADANAVAAAASNAEANRVELTVRRVDVLADDLPAADIAVANITGPVLTMLAPRLRCRWLVSSGYLASEPSALAPFQHVRRVARDGWAADLHRTSAE
jgi:ribosomal protein L11 methyltransferase